MTLYVDPAVKQRRRRVTYEPERPKLRDPLWAKLCLIFGALIMVGSGLAVVVPKVLANWATAEIPKDDLIPDELVGANIDGAINLLLLGMDERSTNKTEPIRADTMIAVHIPKAHDRIYMISFPRDMQVPIPDYPPTGFVGYRERINAAFAFGARTPDGKPDASPAGRRQGAALTMQTINGLVPGGIKFNGAAIINFEGFQKVLEAIGGVRLCVDVETRSIHYDKSGKYHRYEVPYDQRKVYPVGCRNFTAKQALDYSRQRHFPTGDYVRQQHQQQLLMAIFKKLTSKGVLTDLGKVRELQKVAGDLLTLDLGKTDIIDWIFTLKGLGAEDIVMIKTNGGKLANIQGTSYQRFTEETRELLKAVHDDTVFEFLTRHPDWISNLK
jgi:anionic cell wall polymer biosynthesis LytR-Cps2A-Psr (LCP) family protein